MVTPTVKENRRIKFEELFNCFTYPPEEMQQNDSGIFPFDRHCDAIIGMFSKRWNPSAQAKDEYEAHFSTQNWKALTAEKQHGHSLSNCIVPGKPVFEAQPLITLSLPSQVSGSKKREKEEARAVLGELNEQWENRYDHKLTSAIPTVAPQYNLTERKSKSERNRQVKRQISQHIAHQLGENATISHLAEAESLSSYRRKRLSMSFMQQPVKKSFTITRKPNLEPRRSSDAATCTPKDKLV